jgi:DUF1680 family protein
VIDTQYPAGDRIRITVNPAVKKEFAIKFRNPAWSRPPDPEVKGRFEIGPDGYAFIKRIWSPGGQLELSFPMKPRVIVGDHLNQGKAAVVYGPLVLAADDALLADSGLSVDSICLSGTDAAALQVTPEEAPEAFKTWPGARVFRVNARALKTTANIKAGDATTVRLVPFADAGGNGSHYKVWLPCP